MADFYYDLSGLTHDQIMHIIVWDYLEGYSTKQIMDAYRLTFGEVTQYRLDYKKNHVAQNIDFASLKRSA